MTYYLLSPRQLTYAEACKALPNAGVRPMPRPDQYFYAEDLTRQQIEQLKANFTINERDEVKEREDARIRSLKGEYISFCYEDEYEARFLELVKSYDGDKDKKAKVKAGMLEYIKSVRPDLVEVCPYFDPT